MCSPPDKTPAIGVETSDGSLVARLSRFKSGLGGTVGLPLDTSDAFLGVSSSLNVGTGETWVSPTTGVDVRTEDRSGLTATTAGAGAKFSS